MATLFNEPVALFSSYGVNRRAVRTFNKSTFFIFTQVLEKVMEAIYKFR